ncbi:duf602 domain containing protein [Grosmannia clavigera kw1407]|uniref:Duf602 domain containing protein n=1 Tax=Grosmannia clavigera (strain kw1407 / UAMH 11150) TaxID=655863 RepID=F0XP76_GROCL|nr:duf602 domain containing protein [Grosmannia clavigera kw1407]EFX00092.1 duf602 domain containing protein [Grosmannia clavigera kw1407]
MGNDGGSIPKRRELVKSAARLPTVSELKATALEALTHAWQTDPISGNALDLDAVVSDWRGRLFNYETVLEGLLPSAAAANGHAAETEEDGESPADGILTVAAVGIRSVRDIVRLQCHRVSKLQDSLWQCPVTLKELGSNTKAVYIVPCGHVFAEAAVDKILPDKLCPECSLEFAEENVIPILPIDDAELERLRKRMEKLRAEGLAHNLKKEKSQHHGDKKKSKKRKTEHEVDAKHEAGGKGGSGTPNADGDGAAAKKRTEKTNQSSKNGRDNRISGINNELAASLTAKVLAEQDRLQKRRKLAEAR